MLLEGIQLDDVYDRSVITWPSVGGPSIPTTGRNLISSPILADGRGESEAGLALQRMNISQVPCNIFHL